MTRLGVLTVDAELIVRTWDAWIVESTGIAGPDACGRPLVDVVPSIGTRGLVGRFEQVLVSGEVQVLAAAFHHYLLPCSPRQPSSHFDRMQQHVTLGPLRDGDRVVGVMAMIEDVTERLSAARDLTETLRGEGWQTRRTFVERLGAQADRDTVVSVVMSLRTEHRDFNVLSSALKLLSTSDIDVTAQLAELLQDPDPDLRIQAALALGEHDTAAAAEALRGALGDSDPNVRYHAIEALGRMRAADAVDALAEIAAVDDFFLAFPAVDALARINDRRVAPRLVRLLTRPAVGEAAADALGDLGGVEVVPPLTRALNSGAAAPPIARALARLNTRFENEYGGGPLIVATFREVIGPDGVQRILDAVTSAPASDLRPLVTLLGWLSGPAVERALAQLLGTAATRDDVIEAIARQDPRIVDLLIEQLDAEDADTRLAAIVALGRLGSRRARPALTGMLRRDPAEVVAAAAALAHVADPAAYESLLPLLAHADASVRQAAIGALNGLGHPDMGRRVVTMLDSADPRERESAVRIAGYFGYQDAVDAMLARCDDQVEAVRRAAIEHLPFLEDSRAAVRLQAALRDASPKVRAAAARGLGRVAVSDGTVSLLDATRDQDTWVRYFAVRSLGELGSSIGLGRLAEVAVADSAMHVRIAALEALGAVGGEVAVDALLHAVSDLNPELAAAALRGLGQTSDPRAEQALKAALRSDEPTLRLAAVTSLRAGSFDAAVDALAWTAATDRNDGIARAAVGALGGLARRSSDMASAAVDALLAVATEPRLGDAASSALAALPASRIARVAAGLAHARPDVRRTTIGVLGRMKHPDASSAICGALDDDDPTVREAAIVSLERLGTRGIGRRLAVMADADPSRVVRRAASAALGRVDDDSQ